MKQSYEYKISLFTFEVPPSHCFAL